MIECKAFFETIVEHKISFFAGVPDSLLKNFCAYVTDHTAAEDHIISANEGSAIALAAGHFLATGRPGLVYMQNSGLGNAVNPLTSLVDGDVYSIPVLLLIGWRGEPGLKDEPQHLKQGKITRSLLDTLGIEYTVLTDSTTKAVECVQAALAQMRINQRPYALIARKGIFEPYALRARSPDCYELSREDAIKMVAESIGPQAAVVSTAGKASRELFEYRASQGNQERGQDFLTVGSMGHASQIAMGIALAQPNKEVYCLDGDGALIMHLGALASIGTCQLPNFKHIVINNGAHDSVGGQPTVGFRINIPAIAQACGYQTALRAETADELRAQLKVLKVSQGPALLEARVNKGARGDLGRPTTTPVQNRDSFMRFLRR